MPKTKEQLEYRHPQGLTRIVKKPVYLAGFGTFYSASEAEAHLEREGFRVVDIRKHYMKGTRITHYICDWAAYIEQKKVSRNESRNE